MIEKFRVEEWIEAILMQFGLEDEQLIIVRLVLFIVFLSCISALAFIITKKLIIYYIYKLFKKSKASWDDLIADRGVLNNIAHLIPAFIVRVFLPQIFADYDSVLPLVYKITDIYVVIVSLTILLAMCRAAEHILATHKSFEDKPTASYFQLVRIVLYIVAFILVLSLMLGRSPVYFLSAFGAMTAIILLIFKDTILGLVASIQMSVNDMVRVGDWVEMPKFNADGDVIAINLNTVKVQNWDRTITTIPTYYFITDSFKNWRGMVQSGGRRIKRSLYINTFSVAFIAPKKREELKKIELIREYVESRQKEIEEYNMQNNCDTSVLINGRRMTNIGVFRKYIENYLKHHPKIKQDMIMMVRQLAPEGRGIPMEIYCFTDTTQWVEYESIQSDIFDHLFSAAEYFDLDFFQEPGGKDILAGLSQYAKK